MDDFISRQAVIEAMREMYHAAEKWGEKASEDMIKARAESCMASLIEMKIRIENLPSAQKHGKWVSYPECLAYDGAYSDTHIVCSRCNHVWDIMDNDAETFNYCPNCGAYMGGAKK